MYAKEVICSRELCGLILVLSNGRAAFVASQSAHYEPSSLHGVWINCVDNATCASVNVKYKMAAFGRTWYCVFFVCLSICVCVPCMCVHKCVCSHACVLVCWAQATGNFNVL